MFLTDNKLHCKYITQCSGCQIVEMTTEEQIEFKKSNFTNLWKKTFGDNPEIDFKRTFESKFRDRIDVTVFRDNIENSVDESHIEDQKIGFYKKDSRDILDIEECPLSSELLSKAYSNLRQINFPIQKGSLRLRVSPNNQIGLWIDFSNEDIKKLLDEKTTLENLTKIFDIIEIGQKRKKLSLINNQFKLTEPEQNIWFETYDKNLKSIPLQMNVGSFSQTGFKTNKILIENLIKTLSDLNNKPHLAVVKNDPIEDSNEIGTYEDQKWVELCSGSGNLTFPLLSIFKNVIATELDENAIESLRSTADTLNLSDRLHIERINIHKPSEQLQNLLSNTDGVLADPPRSGLQGFLEVISKIKKENLPKNFIYVSCFAETLISDIKVLTELGYTPKKIIGVDQFPHSTHCEWIVRLSYAPIN